MYRLRITDFELRLAADASSAYKNSKICGVTLNLWADQVGGEWRGIRSPLPLPPLTVLFYSM
jgi:hypothetical protein